MKVLDVDLFQDGLQRNVAMLDRLSGEMKAIHHAVKGLVQMKDQLKGAGGNAIRSFYQECHLPFLHFFQLFSEQFKQVLNQMEAALHSLEPDSSGYLRETFLEGELEQGLTSIGELTSSLTDEANSIMDQVSDIVALPHLDDSGVQEGVISSKRKRDDTLMPLDNIYAVSDSADVLWRVKSMLVDYTRLPYEQMVIHGDEIRATDFYGRRVFISENTGQIIKKDIVK